MLIVTGSVLARPDTIDQILEHGLAHVRRSRQEPGCLLHSIQRDVEDPLHVTFLEHWADVDALMAHFGVRESRTFVKELGALAARPPAMQIFDATAVPVPGSA
jgi:quinol monooxygenase YgiN